MGTRKITKKLKPSTKKTEITTACSHQHVRKDKSKVSPHLPPEKGGPKEPEPTRYGDWERRGRCYDF